MTTDAEVLAEAERALRRRRAYHAEQIEAVDRALDALIRYATQSRPSTH